MKFESNTKFSLKKVSSAKWWPFLFRGDDLWLLLICTGGGFLIKNISSSHWKGTFHYTTEYEGPLSQYGFSNPHCCTDLCLVILNINVQIYASQISHPYDIDTCTIEEECLSLEMFNLEIVPYHILCLYVEYVVLCGNKVLLNLNLNLKKMAFKHDESVV